MVLKILKLIPVKSIIAFLPDILAFVLTKTISYVLVKYPNKSLKILETAKDISTAIYNAVEASEDGVISKEELSKQKALWKDVFK